MVKRLISCYENDEESIESAVVKKLKLIYVFIVVIVRANPEPVYFVFFF